MNKMSKLTEISEMNELSKMNQINKISNRLSLLFKIFFIAYPILMILTWFGNIQSPIQYLTFTKLPVDVEINSLRFTLRLYAFLVQLLPTAIVMIGIYYLINLFKLYANNIIFSRQNAILIKKIGFTFIAQFCAWFITQPILSAILTFDRQPGERFISLSISVDEISNLVIGCIIVLISWVMEEGRKLEDEKALVI